MSKEEPQDRVEKPEKKPHHLRVDREKGLAAAARAREGRAAKAARKAQRKELPPEEMLADIRATAYRVLQDADMEKELTLMLREQRPRFWDLFKDVLPRMGQAKEPPKTEEQEAEEALGSVPGELERWSEERKAAMRAAQKVAEVAPQ